MTMIRRIIRPLAIILCCISASKVLANGFGLASQDAFASARGEAFAATANNASAIYYNPAGIAQLEGSQLRSGIYSIYVDPTFQPPSTQPNAGQTYTIGKHFNFIPQVFLTHSFENSPVSVGLGVYAPYGGNMDWPQDTGFRAVALAGSLKYLRINPVIAFKLAPNLFIAGGLMVDYGNIDLESGLSSSTRYPDFFRFKGDGWSVGYNLGALWKPIDQISIGATFRSATKFTMDGHAEFEQLTAGILDTTLPAHANFKFPITAVVGISYRPTPKWNLEFDADYTDWNSFDMTTIYQEGSVPFGGTQNPSVNFDWQPSWIYELGVTRYFDSGWHVSAGYVFNETSVPSAYYTPLVVDMDRHFFSVGAGCKGKRFDFDLAYQFGYGPAHTVSGSTPSSLSGLNSGETADGTYKFISHAILVTVGMRF